jgi:hypothetical protein
MTTRISKPVRREVTVPRHGDLVVTISIEGIYYREKGRRRAFLLPHGVGFMRAVAMQIAAEKAEKKARRATRRSSR